jgi:hypothetical protein
MVQECLSCSQPDSSFDFAGLSGDTAVFRRRSEVAGSWGTDSPQLHLTILLDVSASMFRYLDASNSDHTVVYCDAYSFNGLDLRLQRALECACLVMEGLSGPGAVGEAR